MSIYRKVNRAPADEVHHFESRRQTSSEPSTADRGEWLQKRRATPYDQLLASTAAWSSSLPVAARPAQVCARYPRIANALASGWRDVDATLEYFDQLLTDRRGGRKGFPASVLEELHLLKTFYESLHPREGWRRA
ncbi:MAG TPA: hypothetical protein VMN79_05100 [Casimicrobiaceae bacterium]|nr:hypothetical protein [Casimicrobiaceae bacterium]